MNVTISSTKTPNPYQTSPSLFQSEPNPFLSTFSTRSAEPLEGNQNTTQPPKSERRTQWQDFIESFDDKKLAHLLLLDDAQDKTINWKADGSQSLSQEQIKHLQANYDIEHMSSQDYYNLMSDLTHMNVISAKDIVRSRYNTLPIGAPASASPSCPSAIEEVDGAFSMYEGNILRNMQLRKKELQHMLVLSLQSGDFSSALERLDYQNQLQESMDLYDRFLQIFELLKK